MVHSNIIPQPSEEIIDIKYLGKPPLMLRVKSIIIDSVVLVVLMFIISLTLNFFDVQSSLIRGVSFVLVFLYEPIFISIGQTFGQKLFSIRVVEAEDFISSQKKKKIHFGKSLVRYSIKLILGIVSLITIHSDDYGKGIHDKFVGSVIVNE